MKTPREFLELLEAHWGDLVLYVVLGVYLWNFVKGNIS